MDKHRGKEGRERSQEGGARGRREEPGRGGRSQEGGAKTREEDDEVVVHEI